MILPAARVALPLLLAAVLSCRSVPAIRYWSLEPAGDVPVEAAADAAGLTVGVEPFAVDPPYDDGRLVWRRGSGSGELGFYNYHRWAAPLSSLVAVALAEGLRGTPGVASIVPARIGGGYAATLSGRLAAIELIESAGGLEARIRLDLELVDRAGAVLWSASLARTAAGEAGSDRGAALLPDAFDHLVGAARADLAAALAAR